MSVCLWQLLQPLCKFMLLVESSPSLTRWFLLTMACWWAKFGWCKLLRNMSNFMSARLLHECQQKERVKNKGWRERGWRDNIEMGGSRRNSTMNVDTIMTATFCCRPRRKIFTHWFLGTCSSVVLRGRKNRKISYSYLPDRAKHWL